MSPRRSAPTGAPGRAGQGASALSAALPELIADRAPRVVVVGDVVLDEWLTGPSHRLSREAPVPVVDVARRRQDPGGAAHVAVCLAALGGRVGLVGAVGDDPEGGALRAALEAAGVDTSGVVVIPGARTATKRRVLADGVLVARFDTTDRPPRDTAALEAAAAGALARDPDAVVVCDHGHGTAEAAGSALAAGRDGMRRLVVDAHDPHRWAPLAPDLVTPNRAEAEALLGRRLPPAPPPTPATAPVGGGDAAGGGDDVAAVLEASAAELRTASGARTVVVTLDRDGAVLLPAVDGGPVHRTWATPADDLGTCGAGDSCTAALTLALACDVPERTAVELAQVAADVVVHREGTAACTTADLVAALADAGAGLLGHPEVVRLAAHARERGARIVFTNGCFDVLHAGHIASLNEAKRLGDVLVVALNDDDSVARLKGPRRPVNPLGDRAAVLAALSCVDIVTSFAEDTPANLLRLVRPEVYAKGGDYTAEMLPETEVVRSWGGRVELVDYLADRSTTAVLGRARAAGMEAHR